MVLHSIIKEEEKQHACQLGNHINGPDCLNLNLQNICSHTIGELENTREQSRAIELSRAIEQQEMEISGATLTVRT